MLFLLFRNINDRNKIFLKFPDFKDISVGQIRPLASAVTKNELWVFPDSEDRTGHHGCRCKPKE